MTVALLLKGFFTLAFIALNYCSLKRCKINLNLSICSFSGLILTVHLLHGKVLGLNSIIFYLNFIILILLYQFYVVKILVNYEDFLKKIFGIAENPSSFDASILLVYLDSLSKKTLTGYYTFIMYSSIIYCFLLRHLVFTAGLCLFFSYFSPSFILIFLPLFLWYGVFLFLLSVNTKYRKDCPFVFTNLGLDIYEHVNLYRLILLTTSTLFFIFGGVISLDDLTLTFFNLSEFFHILFLTEIKICLFSATLLHLIFYVFVSRLVYDSYDYSAKEGIFFF
jgi:hypothetical protein